MSFDAPTARVAPHNLEAEVTLLGSLLLDDSVLRNVQVADLVETDFYREGHRLIWRACQAVRERGEPVDLSTLHAALDRAGQLDAAGGLTYLIGLGERVPTAAHAEHYARIVREYAHRRNLISHASKVMRHSYDADMPLEDMQALAATPPALEMGDGDGLVHLGDSLDELMDEIENATGQRGVGTGLKDLDAAINGLEPGRLYVLAARPGMGKSALAFQMGLDVARQGRRVLGFSLEMPAKEITARLLASEARVGLARVTTSRHERGVLNERDMTRLREARARISALPFQILPKPQLRLRELLEQVHKAHADSPLGLFIVDYLQLVQLAGRGGDNATQRITEITNALKALALELNIPVLALSQLSRAVEQRPNHRPQLSDLRESGSIEQDADVVMFIYRDEKYDPNTDQKGIAEIIVGKNRNGVADTVKTQFQDAYVRFQDLTYA